MSTSADDCGIVASLDLPYKSNDSRFALAGGMKFDLRRFAVLPEHPPRSLAVPS